MYRKVALYLTYVVATSWNVDVERDRNNPESPGPILVLAGALFQEEVFETWQDFLFSLGSGGRYTL